MVLRSDDGSCASVVDPVFDTEKSVVVAPAEVVDEIAKSVVLSEVEAAWSERSAYGDEVPSPKFPVVGLKRKVEVPAAPKRTVDDAVSPPKKEIMVVVELVVVPNEVPATVYGKPKV